LYEALVRVLLAEHWPKRFAETLDEQLLFLIRPAWKTRGDEAALSFRAPVPLVGIGAPTHVFLPRVAAALKTDCVLPQHAEVASAIGAISSGISATIRVELTSEVNASGMSHIIHTPEGSRVFRSLEEALSAAEAAATEACEREARARGAEGALVVSINRTDRIAASKGGGTLTGITIIAEASEG
jgi:hypothetical protein